MSLPLNNVTKSEAQLKQNSNSSVGFDVYNSSFVDGFG